MYNNKKRVFIGSSKESHGIAVMLQNHIQMDPNYECVVWDEIFELGLTNFENLLRKVITFDYAIFVVAPDDVVIKASTHEKTIKTRDNIALEIGLFTGELGKRCVYIFKHDSCTLPTDLLGYVYVPYNNDTLKNPSEFNECCKILRDTMDRESKTLKISLKPANGLAKGYFENFIVPTIDMFQYNPKVIIDGKTYDLNGKEVELNIVIPNISEGDIIQWKNGFKKFNKLHDADLKSNNKTRYILVGNFDEDSKVLHIYDIPATLNTSFISVDMLLGAGEHIGSAEDQKIVKNMEVNSFYRTLKTLVNNAFMDGVIVKKYNDYNI